MTFGIIATTHDDYFFRGIVRNSPQHVFSPIFKNESNRLSKTFSTFFNGASLPIGSGNLWTIGYVPLFICFDNRCELVAHTISPLDRTLLGGLPVIRRSYFRIIALTAFLEKVLRGTNRKLQHSMV